MTTNDQAETREIVYPENCTNKKGRTKYKQRILRKNPDILYADYKAHTSGQTGERGKNDLIFYTTRIPEWKSAIRDKYQYLHVNELEYGEGFIIFKDEMLDTKHINLTISFYSKGIVLVQSCEENLNNFEIAFAELKARVHRERDLAQMNNPNNPPPPPSDNQLRDGEERDQPHTAVYDTSSSVTDDFIKLSVK